jgi:hypothetical protein
MTPRRARLPEFDGKLHDDRTGEYAQAWDLDRSQRQFDPAVTVVLTRCLELLDLVVSAAGVNLWLERCRLIMAQLLHGEHI